jgi:uncharacterized protein YggE
MTRKKLTARQAAQAHARAMERAEKRAIASAVRETYRPGAPPTWIDRRGTGEREVRDTGSPRERRQERVRVVVKVSH